VLSSTSSRRGHRGRRWWPRRSPHGLQRGQLLQKKATTMLLPRPLLPRWAAATTICSVNWRPSTSRGAVANANMRFFFLFFENPTCVSDPNYKQGQRQKRAWPFKTWSWIYNFCEPGSNGSLRGAGALRRWRWSEDGWMQFFDKLNLWSKNWQKQKGERVHYRNWLIIRIGILIE